MPKKKTPRRCSRFRCAELKDYICCADCEWRPPLPGGLPERSGPLRPGEQEAEAMSGPLWYCTRQRAGPLVKECRALRPRLSQNDSAYERTEKNKILRPPRDSSVCRTRVDRLELRLALFWFEGTRYDLSFDSESLPKKFQDVRKVWRAFLARLRRWSGGPPRGPSLSPSHRPPLRGLPSGGDPLPLEVRQCRRRAPASGTS